MTATVDDTELLTGIRQILVEILGEDWDAERPLTLDTSLLYDLELESIAIIVLLEQLDRRFPALRLASRAHGISLSDIQDLTLADLLHGVTTGESSLPFPR